MLSTVSGGEPSFVYWTLFNTHLLKEDQSCCRSVRMPKEWWKGVFPFQLFFYWRQRLGPKPRVWFRYTSATLPEKIHSFIFAGTSCYWCCYALWHFTRVFLASQWQYNRPFGHYTWELKAGPLDLSFWSFLTFLHHGIEEVERHVLWKG